MKSLRDLCENRTMQFVNMGISVHEAIEHMAKGNVGAVPVLDAEGKLRGIFSERDVMIKCAAKKMDTEKIKIEEVMTRGVIVMEAHDTYEDCLKIMQQEGIRHMPVRDGDKLIGVVSMRDLMQADVDEKKEEIANLNTFIYYYK